MIGSLMSLYTSSLMYSNMENFIKASKTGEFFEAETGMLGSVVNKLTGGKISKNFSLYGSVNIKSKLAKNALGVVGHYLFNPYVMVTKEVTSAAIQARKERLQTEVSNNIMNYADQTDKYRTDSKYAAISNTMFQNMELANRTIVEVMNSENQASQLLERVLGK